MVQRQAEETANTLKFATRAKLVGNGGLFLLSGDGISVLYTS
jgi:hypothetical protein